ncbi:MAG: hypothetical protein HQL32_07390 [Planctomycetes bacterium]|nr:hypothetical protein [Planctomycetota bacterium]
MKKVILLSLLVLSSCVYDDHVSYRQDSEFLFPTGALQHHSQYSQVSFRHLADSVKKNAVPAGHNLYREGMLTITGKKERKKYNFEFKYNDLEDWSLLLTNIESASREISLHKNHLGLTFQQVPRDLFLQGEDDKIWQHMSQNYWHRKLKRIIEALLSPHIDPSYNWSEEADGLKYYVITRIEEQGLQHIKHQVYLHKKGGVLTRYMKNGLEEENLEDLKYSHYKEYGPSFLPTRVYIKYPKHGMRVDLDITGTQVNKSTRKPKAFKKI